MSRIGDIERISKENWRKAKGIKRRTCSDETNSGLAERNYDIPCHVLSENLICVINGWWIWWCSAHYQPKTVCDAARKRLETLEKIEQLKSEV